MARTIARFLLALAMVVVGAAHFAVPRPFVQIMPAWIGPSWHLSLVLVSGACEVAGGIGLLVPRARRLAGYGLCALYLAVFPANVNMALHRIPMGDTPLPVFALWARLPLQFALIALALWVSRPDARGKIARPPPAPSAAPSKRPSIERS